MNTKLDEFLALSFDELLDRRNELYEKVGRLQIQINNHPYAFADNRLRNSEISSLQTLAAVFNHRIEEIKPKNI